MPRPLWGCPPFWPAPLRASRTGVCRQTARAPIRKPRAGTSVQKRQKSAARQGTRRLSPLLCQCFSQGGCLFFPPTSCFPPAGFFQSFRSLLFFFGRPVQQSSFFFRSFRFRRLLFFLGGGKFSGGRGPAGGPGTGAGGQDRFGRARVLMWTLVPYTLATAFTALSKAKRLHRGGVRQELVDLFFFVETKENQMPFFFNHLFLSKTKENQIPLSFF